MNEAIAETTRLQRRAADPSASAWVSANAGTGKTHVLTQRVLRLLLAGTPPARILCLTYTKAAAAEMSARVFDTLANWVGLGPDRLSDALAQLTGAVPDARTVLFARTLFTTAIETPGGLKVQTIHAFSERLLQRFPLEAGVPPAFTILDEAATRTLLATAIDATLLEATGDPDTPLGRALVVAVRHAADDTFDAVLRETLGKRAMLDGLVAAAAAERGDRDAAGHAEAILRRTFGVMPDRDLATVEQDLADLFDDVTLARLVAALAGGSTTDQNKSVALRAGLGARGRTRIAALAAFFLTKAGETRGSLMTKPTAAAHPDLDVIAGRAAARFDVLDREAKALAVIEATVAIIRLALAVRWRFEQAKAQRAALDFDDLIAKTARLLTSRASTEWVLYKLDGGIDHVLVDEAQDTSPDQWRIVTSIVDAFYGDIGAGSGAATIPAALPGAVSAVVPVPALPRTVFAVGDEKQSIYSFQGAAPHMLAAEGRRFEALSRAAGRPWHAAALTLSFRTVEPVLAAVDATFADPAVTPGIAIDGAGAPRHLAKRIGQAGLVEIWPTERPEDVPETDAWDPLAEATPASPVTRLSQRIAATIRHWLDTGERLVSEDRAVRPGDILVLVRKRAPFAGAIVAALKAQRVPVAGSDRIDLSAQIGVLDLMALGDFLTLPEDDLALANVLKSPLFDFDDDDLFALANARKGTLWKALLDAAGTDSPSRFRAAAEQLKLWRKKADFLPPFEFFATVLDRDGGRMRLLKRLGPEAAEGIDELMNLALRYDDEEAPSLTGFLAWLRADERTVKRDMEQGRDEVRVLTVHGAKGLEAPIVFLPDTCSVKSANGDRLVTLLPDDLPAGAPPLAVWAVKGTACLAPIETAKQTAAAAEAAELNRLLYVALTRPRDRLYVAGVQTNDTLPATCWYAQVERGLHGRMTTAAHPVDGRVVMRLESRQSGAHELPKGRPDRDGRPAPRPAWLTQEAPRERQPTVPFAPSRLAPYDYDASGEPVALPVVIPVVNAEPTQGVGTPTVGQSTSTAAGVEAATALSRDDVRFLPGTLTHALLQHLPTLAPETRRAAAEGYLARRGAALAASLRARIVAETVAVLEHTAFAPLFAPDSRAEVPIVAELPDPHGRHRPLKLNGQIDRLAVTETDVLIVDYKTTRNPPAEVADVPEAYIFQMAAYRAALAQIFPGRTVRAALLWTETPTLMELDAPTLDLAASRLWEVAAAKLDLAQSAS
jgi:ATP-dependent helicase/nuclease subunit A